MKKNIIYLAALVMLAVACNKSENDLLPNTDEPVVPEVKMITETITAINGDNSASTRAAIADADGSFSWSATDLIAVHVSNGKYYITDDFTSGGGNTATFSVTYPEGESRDAFAVYPASLVAETAANYGQSDATLDLTLPASYTLAQVSGRFGTTTPCPMIATNEAGSGWDFYQLCGMLRLTVNCIPPSTSYLEIDFNGNKVQGAFSLTSPVTPGTSIIETSPTDDTDDIITITDLGISGWTDGKVINLPLPTGDYDKVTVTAYNSSNEAIIAITRPFKSSGTYTAARARGRKITATFPVFSVSSSKRVIFAPGNLQATTTDYGANWTWSFAEHQYDYIGNKTNSINNQLKDAPGEAKANGTVDLFYRSVTGNGYGITNTSESANPYYGADFVDWSGLSIGSYPANYWHTLSETEWKYVVGEDSPIRKPYATVNGVANARGTKAVVNSVNGFILFPDRYEGPTADVGTDIVWGAGINSMGASGWNTTCTLTGWTILEEAGCVFLPAAGCRNGSTLTDIGSLGAYLHVKYWCRFRFNNAGFDTNESNGYAGSVRLVHEIN